MIRVCRYEDRLQRIVNERLGAELDVLMANAGKHCNLRVHLLVLARLRDDAALDVAEEPAT